MPLTLVSLKSIRCYRGNVSKMAYLVHAYVTMSDCTLLSIGDRPGALMWYPADDVFCDTASHRMDDEMLLTPTDPSSHFVLQQHP
jgi:hypothetical protein